MGVTQLSANPAMPLILQSDIGSGALFFSNISSGAVSTLVSTYETGSIGIPAVGTGILETAIISVGPSEDVLLLSRADISANLQGSNVRAALSFYRGGVSVADGNYTTITSLRHGMVMADNFMYLDAAPPTGVQTYTLRVTDGNNVGSMYAMSRVFVALAIRR